MGKRVLHRNLFCFHFSLSKSSGAMLTRYRNWQANLHHARNDSFSQMTFFNISATLFGVVFFVLTHQEGTCKNASAFFINWDLSRTMFAPTKGAFRPPFQRWLSTSSGACAARAHSAFLLLAFRVGFPETHVVSFGGSRGGYFAKEKRLSAFAIKI